MAEFLPAGHGRAGQIRREVSRPGSSQQGRVSVEHERWRPRPCQKPLPPVWREKSCRQVDEKRVSCGVAPRKCDDKYNRPGADARRIVPVLIFDGGYAEKRSVAARRLSRRGSSAAGHRVGAGILGCLVPGGEFEGRGPKRHRHHGGEEEIDRFHCLNAP